MAEGQQPRFIVIEGLDGAGTTTQAARLASTLIGRGVDVLLTAEPSHGPVGRVARAHVKGEIELDPLTAALVFTADRADHLEREIRPALAAGRWVVCDRYLLSTLAYQGAEGVDRQDILRWSAGFPAPDLTVVLDVSETERAGRVAARGSLERYEGAPLADRLRDGYRASIALLAAAGQRVETLAGDAVPDDVAAEVLGRLDALPRPPVPLPDR